MTRISTSLTLLLVLVPAAALASCAGPFTFQEYVNMADTVVTGTATSGLFSGGYVNFTVDKYYKGSGSAEIKVAGRPTGEPNTYSSVDYELEKGQRYLLFLDLVDKNAYRTNSCMDNRLIPVGRATAWTAQEAQILGQGTPPSVTKTSDNVTQENLMFALASLLILGSLLLARNRKLI